MRDDKYFIASFLVTIFLMVGIFSTNIEKVSVSRLPLDLKREGDKIIFEKVNIDRLRKMIDEGKLSNKEAMYYRIMDNNR